jgi:hypothetical protein
MEDEICDNQDGDWDAEKPKESVFHRFFLLGGLPREIKR